MDTHFSRRWSRRQLFARLGAVATAAVAAPVWLRGQTPAPVRSSAAKPKFTVYKDPSCGCCTSWVEYMQRNGYTMTVTPMPNMDPIKRQYKIPPALESCHTAIVDGLVIEGHVPVEDIVRFLAEKPKGTIGLTIPGMPQSAPGMDGKPFQPYTVLAFDAAGKTTTYARHTKA